MPKIENSTLRSSDSHNSQSINRDTLTAVPLARDQSLNPASQFQPVSSLESDAFKELRLLQLLPALVMGGVERGTLDIAQATVKSGAKSFVASSGGVLVRELERYGSTHLTEPMHSKLPWNILANRFRVQKLIKQHQINIVHARSRAPAWAGLMAAHRLGIPFVTTFHGTYQRNSPFKHWYNSVMTRGDIVIAISQFISEHIQRFYQVDTARIRVVPRGVDENIFDPNKVTQERVIGLAHAWRLLDGVPVILLPARLSRWKGHELLLEALCKMQRRDLVAVFAGPDGGSDHYRLELEKKINDFGLGNRVRIGVETRDMPAAYALSDIVVSASTQPEAFGRVAAEAGAMGRMVVATNHGGSRETVLDGQGGWLVPPNDSAEMARVLDMVLGLSLSERDRRGEVARQHIIDYYTKSLMCQRTLSIYEELLNRKSKVKKAR